MIIKCLHAGGTVFLCGNGGSMADAQHIAGELVGRFSHKGRYALPAFVLGSNPAAATAIANDFGYEEVFARELTAYAVPNRDVLLAFSTSGRSPNIRRALEDAIAMEMATIGFTARVHDETFAELCDELIAAGDTTPLAQQAHMVVGHLICSMVDEAFS